MTEKGSDELLAEIVDPNTVDELAEQDEQALREEEARVTATAPARDEPGESYPDPDETPDGWPPEYDPLPKEE